jgi:hypothetical protein
MQCFIAIENPEVLDRYMKVAGGVRAPLSSIISRQFFSGAFDHSLKRKRAAETGKRKAKGTLAKLFLDPGTYTYPQKGKV